MARGNPPSNSAEAMPSTADLLAPLGWRREPGEGPNVWRLDHGLTEHSLLHTVDDLATYSPTARVWIAGRFLVENGDCTASNELTEPTGLAEALAFVGKLPSLIPPPPTVAPANLKAAFTPIEALRNIVLFHDGDADFLKANRSTIGDLPFGETSFEEALWQAAREVIAQQPQDTN
jgi:hypothetical protein